MAVRVVCSQVWQKQTPPLRVRPALTIDPPPPDVVSAPAPDTAPARSEGESEIPDTSLESDLPDFDLSNRRGTHRRRPRSIDAARRSVSSIPGFTRLSSIIGTVATSSRPSSPGPFSTVSKLQKRISKSEEALKGKAGKAPAMSSDEIGKDPLPDTKTGLEASLNYHLSELDRLKRHVDTFNTLIEENFNRFYDIQTRPEACAGRMNEALSKLQGRFEDMVRSRDGLWPYVEYHRNELARIRGRTLEIRKAAGEPSPESAVSEVGIRAGEWTRLFNIGKGVRRSASDAASSSGAK